MKTKTCIATLLATIGAIGTTWAAVALDITSPPVTGPLGTGPFPQDPNATQGQWFLPNGQSTQPFVRSHEFYDNTPGNGGGNKGHLAIQGNVTLINGGNWLQGQPITSFTVRATVTNDTATWDNSNWLPGSNSHGEVRQPQPGDPYVGALFDSMLTIEFALTDLTLQPASWVAPYTQYLPEIIATNEDAGAWYCFSGDPVNPGNYFVPAWDFGTIPLGGVVSRDLTFVVNGAINPLDPRYAALSDLGMDILMNRTTDLKIGDWVDVPAIDVGLPYPVPATRSGNASVFFVPEAGTGSLLCLLGILALRRRR